MISHDQHGMGLVEVMIALALLLLTAMAVGNLQTSSMVSAQISSDHFSLDHLSSEMLETLRSQAVAAEAGDFQFDGAADQTASTGSVPDEVTSWNRRIVEAIPSGIGSINCAAGFCDVAISWTEEIDGSNYRQFYRTRTPL